MANLTISVDEEVLKRARIRALEENQSVNALLAKYLESYAYAEELQRRRKAAVEQLIQMAADAGAARGQAEWTREQLHER